MKIESIQQQIANIAEQLPGRPELAAARKKLSEAGVGRAEAQTRANEIAKRIREVTPADLAKRFLDFGKLPDTPESQDLIREQQRVSVLSEAERMQTVSVQNLEASFSGNLIKAAKQLRQPIVERVARALAELRAASAADKEFQSAMLAAGAAPYAIGSVAFLWVTEESPNDLSWLAERRNQGYSV